MREKTVEFKTIFEALPGHFLILEPDSPDYTILAISDELLRITGREREQMVGKSVFEAYPEHPGAVTATGPAALRGSLEKAIRTGQPDHLPLVRYEVSKAGGVFEARYGSSCTKPVLDQAGEVRYLIHSLQEKTNKRLEESESCFRHLVGQAPVAFCLTRGGEGVIESINAAMLGIMGKAQAAEVLGKKMAEALPEVEDQPMLAIARKVADTGEPFQGNEVPVSLRAGEKLEQHFFNVSYTPLIEEGVVTGVIHLATDVTGQVVARQAVEASEARFRSLAQNAPDVITRHGKDYRYLYASPRIEQFTGIRAEDFPGSTYRELGLPDALCALFDEHLAYVFAHQTRHTLEYAMPGGKGYILSRMVPEYNEAGEVDSVLVFSTDISDRKRAEEALRESEEKYRTLFEAMDEGFFLCEVVFDQAGSPVDIYYQEANPAATRIVGEDFTGRRLKEISPGNEARWCEIFGRVARSGQAERLEQYDGSARKWYTLYAFKVGDQHSRKVAVLFRDITERKRREANAAFLVDVADQMSRLSTVEEIMATVGAKIGAYLRVKSCSFVDVDDARGEITVFDAWSTTNVPGLRSHTLRLSDFMNEELSRAGRAGEVLIVHDTLTDPRIEGRDHTRLGIAAYVNVPFHRQGGWTNNLAITDSQPRQWQDDEIELFRELSNRIFPRLERARAEQALQESEQRLRLATEAADMGTWDWNLPTNEIHWNHRHFALLGREPTPGPVRPEDFARQLHPADREWVWQRLQAAVAQQHAFDAEFRIVRADDGQTRWMSNYGQAMEVGPAGDTRRMAGVVFDITTRKQAQQALQQSEEQFRTVVNLVPDLLWRSDAQGETNWYNQRWYEYTGQTPAEAAAYGWAAAVHPDDQAHSVRRYHAAVLSGQRLQQEHRIRSAAGEYRWFQVQALPFRDEQGRVAECFGAATDIHQLKLAEAAMVADNASLEALVAERTQALRESQELLQSVFDTSLIIMMVLRAVRDEAGTVQDFRIVMGNRELARETGRTDLVGKLYSQEYPGVRRTRIYELMLGVLETGEPAGLEYYYPHEGFNKWYASQFVKLDDGVVVTNLDITERKLAEEKIREQAHFIARVNETLPDLMTVTELPSGQVLYINRDPHETPGFEREKVLHVPLEQQTDLLRMHPDDAALLPDYFVRAAALADHEIATYSYRARFNADHWRWFHVRGSVFARDPATGAATRILSVSQDVTARKEAEGELLKSYQVLGQAEQVARMGSWEYDMSTGSFTWSAGMYGLFGLPTGSPIRVETYLDYAVEEDLPVARKIVEKIKQHRPFQETLRIKVDGQEVTLKIKAIVQPDPQEGVGKMLGVDVDLSEVKRLEQENLRMHLQQQQQLLNAILEAQEEERRRISESLHNGVGQILYATKLNLAGVNLAALPDRKPEVEARLLTTEALLTEAIVETRRVSHELVPVLLKEFGLQKATEEFCSRFARTGIQLDCHCFPERLSPQLETALYRMGQELLNNIVRHSGATRARLEVSKDRDVVYLEAQDNGKGIEPAAQRGQRPGKGIGMSIIEDRVKLLGGRLEIDSRPGKGTLVTISLPLGKGT